MFSHPSIFLTLLGDVPKVKMLLCPSMNGRENRIFVLAVKSISLSSWTDTAPTPPLFVLLVYELRLHDAREWDVPGGPASWEVLY